LVAFSLLPFVDVPWCSNDPVWAGALGDGPLDADFADADFACGIHYRRPAVVRQGYPVFGAIGAHFALGIAGWDSTSATKPDAYLRTLLSGVK
jgi:hypothetical protein